MFRPAVYIKVEDLQYQVHDLKKQLLELREDNHLYKVKIRKLQDEVRKRDKQLEMVLDPKRANSIKKMLSQHGATLVLKLREDNHVLQKELIERNQTIRRLQWQIETMKLYYNDRTNGCSSSIKMVEQVEEVQNMNEYLPTNSRRKRSKSVSCKRPSPRPNSPRRNGSEMYSELIQENYLSMLNTNLEIIKNNGSYKDIHGTHGTHTDLCLKSPSMSVPASLSHDIPHEEIQQLQGCLLNVLTEVDSLKDTIVHLKEAQQKTHTVLEEKNCNIEKLAFEIEHLKQHQLSSPNNLKHSHKLEQKMRECEVEMDLSTIEERSMFDYSVSESRGEIGDDETTEATTRATIKLCAKKSIKDLQQLDVPKPSVCVQTIRSCCTKNFTQPDPSSIVIPASYVNEAYEIHNDFSHHGDSNV